jgi:hypothetical protein
MKKMFALMFLTFFFILISQAKASPIINASVTPSNPWLGEDVKIYANCFDDSNKTISAVYANITGPNILFGEKNLSLVENNLYSLTLTPQDYYERSGEFSATVYCVNNETQVNSTSLSFTISVLTGSINDIIPSTIYTTDTIEIHFVIKKDGTPLSSNVDFNVSLNDEIKSLKQNPAFDMNKGWILKIDSPSQGSYELKVTAFYDRANVSNTSNIEVKSPIELDIIDIEKNWLQPNQELTIRLKAYEKGSLINLTKEYLSFKIGSFSMDIDEISQSGDETIVKLKTPYLSPGDYDLSITLTYKNYSLTKTKTVTYTVPLDGEILDIDGKPIQGITLKFVSSSYQFSFVTDSKGKYQGEIPPGTYDLEFTSPRSKLYLYGLKIKSFENPIRYFYLSDLDIDGINSAGAYVYEVAMDFSSAYIEMSYDESKVLDETTLKVYKCSNWNSGKKICLSEWKEIDAEIDTIRNLAKVNTTSFSAYIIGSKKVLKPSFSLDKEIYYLKDLVKIKGIVFDELQKTVSNATVDVKLTNTDISTSTTSDENGVFSIKFFAPEKPGKYELILTVKKDPFVSFNKKIILNVTRSKKLSVIVPDSIKINAGEELTVRFKVINTGQTDFSNVVLGLKGIPQEFFQLPSHIEKLNVGEEENITVNFSIPSDVNSTTLQAEFIAGVGNTTASKVFGFTILPSKKISSSYSFPTFELPLGMFVLPSIQPDMLILLILFFISLSVALILKKRKRKTVQREEIKNLLLGIKREIIRQNSKQNKNISGWKDARLETAKDLYKILSIINPKSNPFANFDKKGD